MSASDYVIPVVFPTLANYTHRNGLIQLTGVNRLYFGIIRRKSGLKRQCGAEFLLHKKRKYSIIITGHNYSDVNQAKRKVHNQWISE